MGGQKAQKTSDIIYLRSLSHYIQPSNLSSALTQSKDIKASIHYGNTGCRVSIGGYKLETFLPRNQHTQRKSLNFENLMWRCQKSAES